MADGWLGETTAGRYFASDTVFYQNLCRHWVAKEAYWTCRETIGAGLQYRDDIPFARFGELNTPA